LSVSISGAASANYAPGGNFELADADAVETGADPTAAIEMADIEVESESALGTRGREGGVRP
jgi:hypothetical protein